MITKEAGKNWIKYLLSEDYKKIFDNLNDILKDMNELLASKQTTIEELLHNARMGMKDREYPKVLYNSWRLVESLDDIFDRVHFAYELKNEMIKQYYREHGGLNPTELEDLPRMHSRTTSKKASIPSCLYTKSIPDFELMTTAGVGSWFQEKLPSFKGMKGAILEKFIANTVTKLKFGAQQSLALAESTYKDVKSMMSKLKGSRDDLMKFVDICKDYQARFETNKKTIAGIYKEHFSEFLAAAEPKPTEIQPAPTWSKPQETIPQQPVQPPTPPASAPSIPDLEPPAQVEIEEPDVEIDEEEEKTVPPTTASKKLLSLVKEAEQNLKEGNTAYAAYLFATASDICTDKALSDKLFITAKSIENV